MSQGAREAIFSGRVWKYSRKGMVTGRGTAAFVLSGRNCATGYPTRAAGLLSGSAGLSFALQ